MGIKDQARELDKNQKRNLITGLTNSDGFVRLMTDSQFHSQELCVSEPLIGVGRVRPASPCSTSGSRAEPFLSEPK